MPSLSATPPFSGDLKIWRMLKSSVLAMLLFIAALPAGASAEQAGGGTPKLVQLSYSEEDGAQGFDSNLGAHIKNADSVKFATGFDGQKARAAGSYREAVTDTDINHPEAKHPWVPAGDDGRDVVKLVHDSLHQNGRAVVRLRMKNGGTLERARVVILLSECSQDPPIYPATCEVKP